MRGLYPSGLQLHDFKPGTNKKFSNAEYLVYQQFEELANQQELFCIYSFRLEHHIAKKQGEIDFLVISPELGIIVLEIKGSNIKKESNGNFYTFNRASSAWELIQNPFKQAEENAFSLIDSISGVFKILRKKPLITWACIFPESDLAPTGLEFPAWRCLDAQQFTHHLYPSLLEISNHEKKKSKQPYDTLSQFDMKAIVEALVGKAFEGQLHDIDISQGLKQLTKFTSSQFKVLDELAENDRLFFQGAAGTGKTFLAIQEFKRLWQNGITTCLVVVNGHLQSWIRSVIAVTHPNLTGHIKVYGEMVQSLGSQQNSSLYSALIVDEVQDVLFNKGLEKLNAFLDGGLMNGQWRFFGDPFRQSISINHVDIKAALKDNGIDPAMVVFNRLRLNVRNTRRINHALRIAADLSETELLGNDYTGENVTLVIYKNNELPGKLNAAVKKIVMEGHPLHRISIIVANNLLESMQTQLDFEYFSMGIANVFTEMKGLTIGEEMDFKGLENDIVLYVLPQPSSEYAKQKLYIGMSRARLRLTAFCNETHVVNYINIIQTENK